MRPLGVLHQKKIMFRLPSIIDTIYGMRRVTVFSYRWRVVYLFSEEFRVQDIATILHAGCTFLKKLIKLYRETFRASNSIISHVRKTPSGHVKLKMVINWSGLSA